MTTQVLRGPGAAKYLGLATQQLANLPPGTLAKRRVQIGDTEIIVEQTPAGKKLTITREIGDLFAIIMRSSDDPTENTIFYNYRGKFNAAMTRYDHPVGVLVDDGSAVYGLTTPNGTPKLYPLGGKTILPMGYTDTDGELIVFAAVFDDALRFKISNSSGVKILTDDYVTQPAGYRVGEGNFACQCYRWAKLSPVITGSAIQLISLDTTLAEFVWPRYVGYENTEILHDSFCCYGNGKIAFVFRRIVGSNGAPTDDDLFETYLVTADLFTDSWSMVNITALGLGHPAADRYSLYVDSAAMTLVDTNTLVLGVRWWLKRADNTTPAPADPPAGHSAMKVFRSVDGGGGWSDNTGALPGLAADSYPVAAGSSKRGGAVLQVFSMPSTKHTYITRDSGTTWSEVAGYVEALRPVLYGEGVPILWGKMELPTLPNFGEVVVPLKPNPESPVVISIHDDFAGQGKRIAENTVASSKFRINYYDPGGGNVYQANAFPVFASMNKSTPLLMGYPGFLGGK